MIPRSCGGLILLFRALYACGCIGASVPLKLNEIGVAGEEFVPKKKEKNEQS